MPLLQLGVPKDIVVALDPFLRAVIETGYDRPAGRATYPTEPVPFQLVPPPVGGSRTRGPSPRARRKPLGGSQRWGSRPCPASPAPAATRAPSRRGLRPADSAPQAQED